MAPAARDAEIAGLVVPSSDSDIGNSQGSSRKYAAAVAMFALVAVIVGGVGMHRHSAQSIGRDAEIGDIIEACADYTVQASCSAASCNWNSAKVQCEEAAHRQKKASFLSTNNEPYVAAAEREDTANSTGNSSATTAAPGATTAAPVATAGANVATGVNGIITATISAAASAGATSVTLADVTGLEVGMYLLINGAYYKIISITVARRLSEAGRRLNGGTVGLSPALSSAVNANTQISALPASTYELTWWKDHGAKFAHAGPAFSAAAAAAATKLATPATPAPATAAPAVTAAPTPAPFGGHDSACHQQFSAATSGQSNAAILTICASYKAGPVGVCTTTDSTTWITTWCASRR